VFHDPDTSRNAVIFCFFSCRLSSSCLANPITSGRRRKEAAGSAFWPLLSVIRMLFGRLSGDGGVCAATRQFHLFCRPPSPSVNCQHSPVSLNLPQRPLRTAFESIITRDKLHRSTFFGQFPWLRGS
jgi:hypothetical protein